MDTITPLSRVLEDRFDYQITLARLPRVNTREVLDEHITDHLDNEEATRNPIILYYRGAIRRKQGELVLKPLQASHVSVSWTSVQEHLKACKLDTVVLFDCDNDDYKPSTLVDRLKDFGKEPRKLEVLAGSSSTAQGDFTKGLADNIDLFASGGAFEFKSVASGLKKLFPRAEYFNCTRPIDDRPIKLHSLKEIDGGNNSHGRRRPSWKSHPIIYPSHKGNSYGKVIVLPIAWADHHDESFDPLQELARLTGVFTELFPFTVKEPFLIPSTDSRGQRLLDAVQSHSRALNSDDLFIVLYNGHGKTERQDPGNLYWARGPKIGDETVNWTSIVQMLNKSQCDVLQVLDCCYAGAGTKGSVDQFLRYSNIEDQQSGFTGRNEILAASSRDYPTRAGEFSSMPLFAEVLRDLAWQNETFTVDHWYHAIDSRIHTRMVEEQKLERREWHVTPYRKMNPIKLAQNSIPLQRKDNPTARDTNAVV